MEVSAPSPGETPENTATAEEASARLSSTECRDDADDADDADGVGTGRSQFCFAKTTQEEERARREANGATGSPQSPSQNVAYASAPAPVDLSQFAFVATATATVHQTAKTTVPEDSAAPKLAPPPCGACAEAEPPTLSGSSSLSVIPVSLSQEPPKEVKRTAAKSRAKSRTKTSVPPHWQRPLPAELGGPVALTPAGPASAAPSPEAEVKKGKQGRHADSEASASMLEVRRAISDDDSDAPLAKRIRRRATAPARLTPGKAPKAKARAGAAAVPSARPTTAASQANLEGESKAPEQSKKRAAPSRQEPSKKCRKAAASKETAKPKALRALKDTAFANPAEAAVAAANGRPVFATTGLELSSRQQKFLLDLQGLMVAEWNPHVSHLIADTFRRTTKMMCAICTGAHILSTEYVKACREAGRLVDEAAFLLKDEVCEAAFARKRGISQGYSLAAALQRARQNGPLLQGMSVYCFPSVGEKRELPMLVAAAGGTWLKRFPLQPACTSVLLLAERCVSSEREQQRRRVYEVYDVELLREAACTQELRRSAYRLQ